MELSKDCPLCGAVFTTHSNRNRHINQVHGNNDLHACPLCHKTFSRKDKLDQHMIGHGNQQQREESTRWLEDETLAKEQARHQKREEKERSREEKKLERERTRQQKKDERARQKEEEKLARQQKREENERRKEEEKLAKERVRQLKREEDERRREEVKLAKERAKQQKREEDERRRQEEKLAKERIRQQKRKRNESKREEEKLTKESIKRQKREEDKRRRQEEKLAKERAKQQKREEDERRRQEEKLAKERTKQQKREEDERRRQEEKLAKERTREQTISRKRKIPHAHTIPPKRSLIVPDDSDQIQDDPVIDAYIRDWDPANEVTPDFEEDPVIQVYMDHWESIKDHSRRGPVQSVYNFRWDEGASTPPNWDEKLFRLFAEQDKRFKINYSHSFILHNQTEDTYRFFHASNNNANVLAFPQTIHNREDFLRFVQDLQDDDPLEYAKQQRPDSAWTVYGIVATSFYINPLSDFPIGCCDVPIPDSIKRNKHILSLLQDKQTRTPYVDNFCFFRCLALHNGANEESLETETETLASQWEPSSKPEFPGICLGELNQMEELFEVNVDVFQMDQRDTLVPLRRSETRKSSTLRVLLFENHFCYISNMDKAVRAFGCPTCGRLWKKEWMLKRHEKQCQGSRVRETFPGGVYHIPKNTMEILREHGVSVDPDFVYPFRATYDFESYQDPKHGLRTPTKQTRYLSKHVPMSVSVCSNVPGFTDAVCFVSDGDSQDLVDSMIDYLTRISDAAFSLLKTKFSKVYSQIRAMGRQDGGDSDRNPDLSFPPFQLKSLLDSYLHELPVIGFNSSKYDINLVKPYFFSRLLREEDDDDDDYAPRVRVETDIDGEKESQREQGPIKFIVKDGNEYKCVSTRKLKFLDIKFYLAPGYSYAKYLAAFEVKERKGFFPFDFVTGLDKLDCPNLPQKQHFDNSLKGTSISDEDYAFCQKVWEKNQMRTMKDFLVWYNNLDVAPFLEALEKQSQFYNGLGLDMFKDAIGVPGLTLRYLFKTIPADTYFSLTDHRHKDFHQLMRQEIVGGPSIIFHRYHEKEVTRIRGEKPVESLSGFDANALYLWCLSQQMPSEHPVYRRKNNGFKADVVDKFGRQAREWVEWISFTENIPIRHKFNNKEYVLGERRIPVDGWNAQSRTAYQFHGCLFHGHDCSITRGKKTNPVNGKLLTELRTNTTEITTYLREKVGVNVVEMWECEWQRAKQNNPRMKHYLQEKCPPYKSPFPPQTTISTDSILKAVETGALFGLVQCDIEVPEHLKPHFEEMQPIFKNAMVGREDLGEFMKAYATKHKLLSQPKRTLVGSFFGKGILLITPLLRWYLSKGLRVTDIQQVVEFRPQACFRRFAERASHARRQADCDPSKTILADGMKLFANSAYGKTVTNIAKHRDISYVEPDEAQKLVTQSLFKKLTPLDGLQEDLVEVEMAKSRLVWNLPNQIGFFVYQYAKLRMLQFYYDVVDRYVDRSDFQMCEMDTDSLYMALSGDSLEEVVRPETKQQFFQQYPQWFPAQACDTHHAAFVAARVRGEDWSPPLCCMERQRFDKRTPGLFKLEYKGEGIVALCSKTYYCFGREGDKHSSKGLSKHQNRLTKHSYLNVLHSHKSAGGINKGFRTDGTAVYTYEQKRLSLSFFYPKRQVQPDGISTAPSKV